MKDISFRVAAYMSLRHLGTNAVLHKKSREIVAIFMVPFGYNVNGLSCKGTLA